MAISSRWKANRQFQKNLDRRLPRGWVARESVARHASLGRESHGARRSVAQRRHGYGWSSDAIDLLALRHRILDHAAGSRRKGRRGAHPAEADYKRDRFVPYNPEAKA